MKNYYLIILLIILYPSLSIAEIDIKKNIKNPIENYKEAIVTVKNDNYASSNGFRIGSNEIILESQISKVLKKFGIDTISDENESSLRVECHFHQGWGIPHFMRHFKISAKYITFINIKFIDFSSNEVIGEVEYKKPFFVINQKDIINTIMTKLIKSQ